MSTLQGTFLLLGLMAFFAVGRAIAQKPVRGLYLAIFAAAILLTPQLPVVRDKVATCELVVGLTWAILLFHRQRHTPLLATQKRSMVWALLVVAAAGLSCWANAMADTLVLSHSLVELFTYLYGVLLFLTVVYLIETWEQWLRCLYAWTLGTAVVSAVAALTLVSGGPAWAKDEFTGRISATLKFSNQLPGYCIPVLTLIVMVAALRSSRFPKRVQAAALAAGIGLAVIGCGSRLGLLLLAGSIVAVVALALYEAHNTALNRPFLVGIGAVAAAGVTLFALHVTGDSGRAYALGKTPAYERAIRMTTGWLRGEHGVDDTRTRQLQMVVEKAPQQLLVGVGPANFTMRFHCDEIHNTYVGVLAEEGILGLAALVGWLVSIARNGRLGLRLCPTGTDRLVVLAVLVGFAMLLIYGTAMFGLRQRPFWFLAGLLAALPRVQRNRLVLGGRLP